MTLTVYQYPKCGTCRKALKWLDENAVAYESVHIVDAPPSQTSLKKLMERSGLPTKSFFNTSGESYRNGGFKDRVASMSTSDAAKALAADGKLIKRPLVVSDDLVLVGFDEETWGEKLL